MLKSFFGNKNKTADVRMLWRKGDMLIKKGKTGEAEKLLLEAANSASPIDRHYAYTKLIGLYRRKAPENREIIPVLADICRRDIELLPDFFDAWSVEYMGNVPTPYFPSFSVLAEIMEDRGEIDEAIRICELALGYGLTETIGEDYSERLNRLYAKRGKNTPPPE